MLIGLLSAAGNAIAQAPVRAFDIQHQDLSSALSEFARQSDRPILFSSDVVRAKRSNGVRGDLQAEVALERILKGTGLTYRITSDNTILVEPTHSRDSASMHASKSVLRLAQADSADVRGEDSAAEKGRVADSAEVSRPSVEEIIVTARKREERLQDVPASIAAVTGETLADQNIISLTELDTIAPGLTFATNPSRFGSGPAVALRGISTQTQSSAIQDSVGIVIDGVPIVRAKAGSFPDLSDTARVEVLRGPQGTLFGMNASAGVISITTKDPTQDFSAEIGAEYATHNDRTFRASVSGPIVDDRLLGRLSVYGKARDGYVKNVFDGTDWEKDEQKGFRGKVSFLPTTDDTIKLSVDFIEQNNDAGANVIREFTPVTPQYVRDNLSAIAGTENDRINARSFGDNRHQSGGAALQWDRSVGEHTLTALAGYRIFKQDAAAGTYTWPTPLNEGPQFHDQRLEQSSVEVRLASPSGNFVEYVAGLFFIDYNNRIASFYPGTLTPPNPVRGSLNQVSNVDTLNYAAFAEANFNFTERFSLTAGARWTHEETDIVITGFPIQPGLTRLGHPLGTTDNSATASKPSWKLAGRLRLDDDRMLYALLSTGFKGPAFNSNTGILGDAQRTRPETATNAEIGMKSQFFDRRLTFNIDVFYSVFEDFQTQGGLLLPGNPLSQIVLLNAGELLTQGVEMDIAASLSDSMDIGVTAAYIDATFKEYRNAPCYPGQQLVSSSCATSRTQDLTGTRLPNTPEWNVNLFAKKFFDLPVASWRAFGTLDYSWRSSVQWNNVGSPQGIEDAYGLLGASLGLQSADERISVKVYGKNLTDKFHTSGISAGDQITHFLPPDYRRIVGIDVSFSY